MVQLIGSGAIALATLIIVIAIVSTSRKEEKKEDIYLRGSTKGYKCKCGGKLFPSPPGDPAPFYCINCKVPAMKSTITTR